MPKALQFFKGSFCKAVLKDPTVPGLSGTRQEMEIVQKPDTRIRIFSGTANLSLAQVLTFLASVIYMDAQPNA